MTDKKNRISRYLLYAIGEIILVVIGILIALEINTQNDLKKQRAKEIHYLENIKMDLEFSKKELENYIATRKQLIENASLILEYFEGKELSDLTVFNELAVPIYSWQKYHQNNNTYQELINSGNLALLTNDSIKTMLMNLESLYKIMKSEEEHFRFDTEELIYKPLYSIMDLNRLVKNFSYRVSNGQVGEDISLSREEFEPYMANIKLKNGFAMAVLEFNVINSHLTDMKEMSEMLIQHIDQEIAD
jgi:hypothetical protein